MHTPEQAADIALARRIVMGMLGPYGAKVYLFGSAAKGTMHRRSDIDIAVLPAAELPVGLLSQVREALEQSHILRNVDLVDLSQAGDALKAKVLQEGELWTD